MRPQLNLKQSLISFITLLFIFFASYHHRLAGNETLSVEVITNTGSDASTGKLSLEDINGRPADNFNVNPGAKMQWLLKANAVKDITNIYAKPNNPNV